MRLFLSLFSKRRFLKNKNEKKLFFKSLDIYINTWTRPLALPPTTISWVGWHLTMEHTEARSSPFKLNWSPSVVKQSICLGRFIDPQKNTCSIRGWNSALNAEIKRKNNLKDIFHEFLREINFTNFSVESISWIFFSILTCEPTSCLIVMGNTFVWFHCILVQIFSVKNPDLIVIGNCHCFIPSLRRKKCWTDGFGMSYREEKA